MKSGSKFSLWIAGLAAFLLGMPLTEKASAGWGGGGIVGSSLGLAGAIIDAAGSS